MKPGDLPASGLRASGTRAPYLAAAVAVGEQLVAAARRSARGATWDGDDLEGHDPGTARVVRRPVGADLYGGTAGIAWFLAHLAAVNGSREFVATAVAAIRDALARSRPQVEEGALSLYAGATGVALSAVEVGERLARPTVRRAGLVIARRVAARVAGGHAVAGADLISGRAGILIGLLAIYRRTGEPTLLDACRTLSAQLTAGARHDWWGCSWPEADGVPGAPGLCGLGHGASGIGWALVEAAWAAGDEPLAALADEAFRYERSWYAAERGAWPDLREPDARSATSGAWPGWTTAWCHGALGIGAVRLRVYEATRDTGALAEASAAIHAARGLTVQAGLALRGGQLADVTLCHGLGGAAELALLAHEVLGSAEHLRAARRIGDLALGIFEANGRRWTCGLSGAEHVPGLFLGLAGIGVTLLRLHDPAAVGSPLLAGRSVCPPGGPAFP